MNAVRDRASVAPSTITALSRGEVAAPRRKTCPPGHILRVRDSTCVKVDARIMAYLHQAGVDFRYVEVRSETEVVVRNSRVR